MSQRDDDDAEKVKIESENRSKLAKEIGKKVSDQIDENEKISSIETNTKNTNVSIGELNDEISRLKTKIVDLQQQIKDIERTKAAAKRDATESIKNTLQEQYEEKKQQFEKKKQNVLGDYQDSILRLKDRFIKSIPGQSEGFDQVQHEFDDVSERRQSVVDTAERLGTHGHGSIHDFRHSRLEESRSGFTSAIDDFLADRRETANTIDSLQTSIPRVNGNEQLTIPFWVVGIEKNGREEIKVLPVLTHTQPEQSPTDSNPYVSYLEPHDVHEYGDWTDAVKEYVVRDEVRDKLANQEQSFGNTTVLRQNSSVKDRFVDALEEFELSQRDAEISRGSRVRSSGTSQRSGSSQPETEVSTDD